MMVARATAEALTESLRAAMVEIVEQTNDTVVGAHARPSGADAARITARTLEAAVAGLVNERAPASDAPALKRVARVELGRAQIKVTLAGELPLEIVAPILLKHRSNAVLIQPEGQRRSAPGVDRALVRALALATDWALA